MEVLEAGVGVVAFVDVALGTVGDGAAGGTSDDLAIGAVFLTA